MQLIFCLLVLVTPFLSGAPPPKKNPRSATERSHVAHGIRWVWDVIMRSLQSRIELDLVLALKISASAWSNNSCLLPEERFTFCICLIFFCRREIQRLPQKCRILPWLKELCLATFTQQCILRAQITDYLQIGEMIIMVKFESSQLTQLQLNTVSAALKN